MGTSHIAHLKITCMVEITSLHITHTGGGKITAITTTQHHFDHHIQAMSSETFATGVLPDKVIGFITTIHMSIPILSSMHVTLLKIF